MTTKATGLADEPDAQLQADGETFEDDIEVEGAEAPEPLRTRASRGCLLALFPCAAFLNYGASPDDELSTSDKTRATEQERMKHLKSLTPQEIREVVAAYGDLHREEEARKSSAETRLTAVLGMSSVLSAITFGFISLAFDKLRAVTPRWIAVVATAAFVYAVTQLVISFWHAVRGLQVRKISELSGSEILRKPGESEKRYLVRRACAYAEVVRNHDTINSDKSQRLHSAHQALLNFLRAVLLLVLLLVLAGWLSGATSRTDLARELRGDPEIVKILRGPKGDRGEIGPAGARGPAGPPGASATCPPSPRH